MGTEHPLVIQAGSARFGWVVACQPRRDANGDGRVDVIVGRHGELLGDEALPYLLRGPGPGQPIARYFGSSPDGRYLALREGTLHVLDSATGKRHELGSHAGRDSDRSWLSFSRAHQLAFIQDERDAHTVVVLDLLTAARRIVHRATGDRYLWQVELADDGTSLSVLEIADDSDGDGVLRPPRMLTNRASGRCVGPAPSSTTFRRGGDDPRRVEISLPERPRPPAAEERIVWQRGCVEDGRPAIAGSPVATLVASGKRLNTEFGPVRWIEREPRQEYCQRDEELPPCDGRPPAPGEFCDFETNIARRGATWGWPPRWLIATRDYLTVEDALADDRWPYDAVHGSGFDAVFALGSGTMAHWNGRSWNLERDAIFARLDRVLAVGSRAAWAFGEDGRIAHFDGARWIDRSLPEDARVLALWSNGEAAWAATSTRSFEWLHDRWHARPGPALGSIVGFAGRRRPFAISSEGQLVHWSGGAWRVLADLVPRPRRFWEWLTDIQADDCDELWVTSSEGVLFHWNGERVRSYDSGNRSAFERVLRITPDSVWLGGRDRLIRFAPAGQAVASRNFVLPRRGAPHYAARAPAAAEPTQGGRPRPQARPRTRVEPRRPTLGAAQLPARSIVSVASHSGELLGVNHHGA